MNMHLLNGYNPGYGLPRAFYTSEDIFAAEQERIFRNNWFFAGHSVELPKSGDYMTLNVGGAPVVVGWRISSFREARSRGSASGTSASTKPTRGRVRASTMALSTIWVSSPVRASSP